ncbi:mannosyl-oligosaccharide alpha-1,2-mannosidase [Boothiomyces macroporosus]|uniref:Meiosis-specific nuclear structural protein 1 n=1 Tax=Boothiomyces macroporosus TaxID=261099 RepID=A0AAD5UF73_9FUNG|nr:mannosyl-oligosaccharide alpha-1,2-mannosidase [Boothiomyces macroporosus]
MNPSLLHAKARRVALEKREMESRKRQDNRRDILKELHDDTLLLSNIASDIRVDHMRRTRQYEMQKLERDTIRELLEDQQRAKQIQEELRKEEEMVREMELYHQEQVKEQKLRQSIRENSSELRELEKKLNHAYMNKERSLQMKEKELMIAKKKAEEQAMYAVWKEQAEIAELEEKEREKKNHEKAIEYHQALHHQLEENEEKKQKEYEIFLKEKEMVDKIVQKIAEENEREAASRLEKQEETKKFIEQFMRERAQWKEEERRLQEEENRKIAEFAQLQKAREEKVEIKKKTIAAGKDAIYNKLASQIEHQEKMKIELEDLRIDLAQEEQEAQARRKEHEMLQQRIQKRLETIDAYQAQVADKKRRIQEERLEEDKFREKLMQKFAEDDRIEQMKQAARRMKQLEHRRAVDELVKERKRIHEANEMEKKRLENVELELARYRAEVIEQERQRLLREHASKLAGFLPKGVLRDKKDLDLFDQEFVKKFGETKI